MNYFSKPTKNKITEDFGLRQSKTNLKILLVKFGFKISKMETPNNLSCDTNETFLSDKRPRLRKVCSLKLIKTSKPS